MKLINKFMLLMAVVLFAACSTDVDTPQINSSDKFVTPIIGQCTDVIINADNKVDITTETVRYSLKPHKVFLFNKETEERIRYEVK